MNLTLMSFTVGWRPPSGEHVLLKQRICLIDSDDRDHIPLVVQWDDPHVSMISTLVTNILFTSHHLVGQIGFLTVIPFRLFIFS